MIPTIIVHGGAGWWADEQDAPKSEFIIEAVRVGCDILKSGGSPLDAVEKAAVDYAIAQGVIIVASAGNEGTAGMGYPGAYAPVISVAASGRRSTRASRP